METTFGSIIEFYSIFSTIFISVVIFFIFLNTYLNPLGRMLWLVLGALVVLLSCYGLKLLLGNISIFKHTEKVICNIFSVTGSVFPDLNLVFLTYIFSYFLFTMFEYNSINSKIVYLLFLTVALHLFMNLYYGCQNALYGFLSIGLGLLGGYIWFLTVNNSLGDDYLYFSKNKDGSTTNCYMVNNKYKCVEEKNGGFLMGF